MNLFFKNRATALVLFLFFLSLILNIFLYTKSKHTNSILTSQPEKHYQLVNQKSQVPIDSNVQTDSLIIQFNDLKPAIEKEISHFGAEQNIGFFLQDSTTGAWLGINEKTGFTPASLLKIPIMLGILKKVTLEEISLKDNMKILPEDLDSNSGKLYKKGAGYEISFWNLLEEMILTSDNTAKNVLRRQLSPSELNAIFAHVGIPNPYQEKSEPTITPRGYTRLFKALYFATYVSPELSEKALSITTDTQMESLISAGVPLEIQVAHKYGERPDGISDCGIVYENSSPYYLCIMTKDLELSKSKELISSLSKITYDFISNKK